MLHEVSGDILLSKAQTLAHGIAPNDPWDSGLALALREFWPAMAKDYRHYAHGHHPKPGELWMWGTSDGRRIFNLLTQEGDHTHGAKPGKASLANVNHALRRLRHEIDKGEITSLAMPRIATGVGGLAWPEVHALIAQHLGDLKIPVYIYTTYQKGVAAKEPA